MKFRLGDVPPWAFLMNIAYWAGWILGHGLTTWTELP